jgi:hypothetical protein
MNPTKKQIEAHQAYIECGRNVKDTSKHLGIAVNNLKKLLFNAHLNGLTLPTQYCQHLPAGISLDAASVYVSKDGDISGWYKGSSLLSDQDKLDMLLSHIESRKSVRKCSIKKPSNFDDNIQLEWTLADIHYGMLAWDKETGADYDTDIARELIIDSASEIFSRAGKVKETVLVLMGDNFHSDFKSNHTEKSGHHLDVDSRHPRIMKKGVETFIDAIEICLQFSEKVRVVVLYGNHDGHSSVYLQYCLYFNFKGTKVEDRVFVELVPSKSQFNIWGSVATIYHHGDGTKPDRVCHALVDHLLSNDITGIRYLYAKQGHLHNEFIKDIGKVTYEVVPSPVAKDSYAAGANFISKRATVATIYDKVYGEVDRYSITPRGLEKKKELL